MPPVCWAVPALNATSLSFRCVRASAPSRHFREIMTDETDPIALPVSSFDCLMPSCCLHVIILAPHPPPFLGRKRAADLYRGRSAKCHGHKSGQRAASSILNMTSKACGLPMTLAVVQVALPSIADVFDCSSCLCNPACHRYQPLFSAAIQVIPSCRDHLDRCEEMCYNLISLPLVMPSPCLPVISNP